MIPLKSVGVKLIISNDQEVNRSIIKALILVSSERSGFGFKINIISEDGVGSIRYLV